MESSGESPFHQQRKEVKEVAIAMLGQEERGSNLAALEKELLLCLAVFQNIRVLGCFL